MSNPIPVNQPGSASARACPDHRSAFLTCSASAETGSFKTTRESGEDESGMIEICMRLANSRKGGLIENFFFAFLRDHCLERGDYFVPPGHHAVYLVLGQIIFGFFRQLAGVERFQPL